MGASQIDGAVQFHRRVDCESTTEIDVGNDIYTRPLIGGLSVVPCICTERCIVFFPNDGCGLAEIVSQIDVLVASLCAHIKAGLEPLTTFCIWLRRAYYPIVVLV